MSTSSRCIYSVILNMPSSDDNIGGYSGCYRNDGDFSYGKFYGHCGNTACRDCLSAEV